MGKDDGYFWKGFSKLGCGGTIIISVLITAAIGFFSKESPNSMPRSPPSQVSRVSEKPRQPPKEATLPALEFDFETDSILVMNLNEYPWAWVTIYFNWNETLDGTFKYRERHEAKEGQEPLHRFSPTGSRSPCTKLQSLSCCE